MGERGFKKKNKKAKDGSFEEKEMMKGCQKVREKKSIYGGERGKKKEKSCLVLNIGWSSDWVFYIHTKKRLKKREKDVLYITRKTGARNRLKEKKRKKKGRHKYIYLYIYFGVLSMLMASSRKLYFKSFTIEGRKGEKKKGKEKEISAGTKKKKTKTERTENQGWEQQVIVLGNRFSKTKGGEKTVWENKTTNMFFFF